MDWKKFTLRDKAFAYPGAALKKNWARLHRGDCQPFPDDAPVQAAWRSYHSGDFGQAVELGLACGLPGYAAANKAAVVYASYLETDEQRRIELLLDAAKRCEEQQRSAPHEANAWYLHAFALGRYSQLVSVLKALGEGLGGKIRSSLERTIELQPQHADAHIALGAYHAEVIDKVGTLVGGLTYGAKKASSVEHFARALELNPDSAIARVEYARGLRLMYGRAKQEEAQALLRQAVAATPADAMEALDVAAARDELEA